MVGHATRRGGVKVITLVVLALLIVVGIFMMRPKDERLIRNHLEGLSETLDKQEGETMLVAAVTAKSISGFFTRDASVHVGPPVGILQGHQSITATALRARPGLSAARFTFTDVSITLQSKTLAECRTTVELHATFATGEKEYQVRELRLVFSKIDGDWLISQVETVATLE